MPKSHTGELEEKKQFFFQTSRQDFSHVNQKGSRSSDQEEMRTKKYVTHRFKGLVNSLPPSPRQKKPKFSEYMDIYPSRCLPLKY